MRDTLPERFVRKHEEKLYAQGIARVFARQQVHLALQALLLLRPDRDMPPALRRAVFDLHQNKRFTAYQREIGLRKLAAVAVYGQPAVRHVDGEGAFFGQPAAHVRMEALGKAVQRR